MYCIINTVLYILYIHTLLYIAYYILSALYYSNCPISTQEMNLVASTWLRLKERVVNILARLEEAASLSYQIKLEVGPRVLGNLFDKVAGLVNTAAADGAEA